MAAIIGLTLVAPLFAPSVARAEPPNPAPKSDRSRSQRPKSANVPHAAAPGPRSFEAVKQTFSTFVRRQPYGQHWTVLLPKEKAPKSKAGRGKAKTHPALANDRAEVQSQVQYLADTTTVEGYGTLTMRGVRLFRYGRLVGAQLVVDKVGRGATPVAVAEDRAALMTHFADPVAALGLPRRFVETGGPARAKLSNQEWPVRFVFELKSAASTPDRSH